MINMKDLINYRTSLPLSSIIPVKSPQTYIYVIENSAEKIKIGKSRNPVQRFKSLSGSNGAGEKIQRVYVTESTYLHSIEKAMHSRFNKYRIPDTEWFDGISFEEVCMEFNEIMNSDSYKKCNKVKEEKLNG